MPAAPPPSAQEWFQHFKEEFNRSSEDPSTEVGIHYLKWETRGRLAAGEPEWTDVIAIFLSRLARSMEYFQDWEHKPKRTDFVWYEGDQKTPAVAIEHENDYKLKIEAKEIPNLLSSNAALKVLITYAYTEGRESVEQVTGRILKIASGGLRKSQPSGEFLLVLGPDDRSDPWRWRGFVWEEDRFVPLH